MIASAVSPVLAGLGVGVALAGAPGPVQAVLLGEAIRGGVARGFRAMAGANLTTGLLLMALALGLTVAPPSGLVLRALQVCGGALLLWIALDAIRAGNRMRPAAADERGLPPVVRGALAVVLNPGAWLFFGAVASPLLGGASRRGGMGGAVLTAVALTAGLAMGDGAVVVLGGVGVRRAGERVERWVRRVLAALLGSAGLWLLVRGSIT